jgi:uncharacterized protein (DUF433 family)
MDKRRVRKLFEHVGKERGRSKTSFQHRFGPRDVYFCALASKLPTSLTTGTIADLYVVVSGQSQAKGQWRLDGKQLRLGEIMTIETPKVRHDVASGLNAYRALRRRITSNPETMGGEPVFKGTRISVAHVGALASRGRPLQEILEDYPRLSADDVRLAEIVFKMGPRPGRPRKPLKLKR